MDGSAWPFTLALKGQVVPLNVSKRLTIVRRAVRVNSEDGKAHASLWSLPGERSLDVEVMTFDLSEEMSLVARTFWSRSELERWRAKELILGGGMDNSLLYEEGGKVLNSEGLRYSDEICRHLAVDCIGDLRLGGVVLGRYTAVRPAHWLNVEKALQRSGQLRPRGRLRDEERDGGANKNKKSQSAKQTAQEQQ
ncbi:UDP-3-O-acyl-N-acetylglucosamine deacetylase [Gracilaria domingensis]|nr:UDP-3-O-acyl-N-acetylglucosamine deacetylase [Gracilaria domingensis]